VNASAHCSGSGQGGVLDNGHMGADDHWDWHMLIVGCGTRCGFGCGGCPAAAGSRRRGARRLGRRRRGPERLSHSVSGYTADVGVSYPVHAGSVDGSDGDVRPTATGTCSRSGIGGMGEVVTDAAGGCADLGAAGAVAHEWALDSTMVSSIGDDLTVDGLIYTYPPRAAPAAQKPSDIMQSSRSSEGGTSVSSCRTTWTWTAWCSRSYVCRRHRHRPDERPAVEVADGKDGGEGGGVQARGVMREDGHQKGWMGERRRCSGEAVAAAVIRTGTALDARSR